MKIKCDQCEMLSINGVACHETGCPNADKVWSDGEWRDTFECPECGQTYECCVCSSEAACCGNWGDTDDFDDFDTDDT